MRTAGDAFLCAIVCAACARNGALSRLGCAVVPETMIFSCAVRLHAPPRGHALRACVVSRRGNIAHGRMKGDLDPESDVHTSGSVHSPLACARTRTRAPQSVFDFFLHLFTRVRQLLDSKKDRGEGFVRKRGDFLHFLGISAQFSVDIQGSMVERSVNLSATDDLMKSVKVNKVRESLFRRRYINN